MPVVTRSAKKKKVYQKKVRFQNYFSIETQTVPLEVIEKIVQQIYEKNLIPRFLDELNKEFDAPVILKFYYEYGSSRWDDDIKTKWAQSWVFRTLSTRMFEFGYDIRRVKEIGIQVAALPAVEINEQEYTKGNEELLMRSQLSHMGDMKLIDDFVKHKANIDDINNLMSRARIQGDHRKQVSNSLGRVKELLITIGNTMYPKEEENKSYLTRISDLMGYTKQQAAPNFKEINKLMRNLEDEYLNIKKDCALINNYVEQVESEKQQLFKQQEQCDIEYNNLHEQYLKNIKSNRDQYDLWKHQIEKAKIVDHQTEKLYEENQFLRTDLHKLIQERDYYNGIAKNAYTIQLSNFETEYKALEEKCQISQKNCDQELQRANNLLKEHLELQQKHTQLETTCQELRGQKQQLIIEKQQLIIGDNYVTLLEKYKEEGIRCRVLRADYEQLELKLQQLTPQSAMQVGNN